MAERRDCLERLKSDSPIMLPSLLLCDFGNLKDEIARLEAAGVRALHLDVMDGTFVPNFSYGMTIVDAIRKLTEMPLDVHLMMVNPEKYIQQFFDAGADIITVHAESTDDLPAVLKQIRSLGAAAGIALNPDTPVASIESSLPFADMVLVMSVHAGFGGQSFIESVLSKFNEIRSLPGGDEVILEIDGGINSDTVGAATAAGAQWLVAGSAIFKQRDYSVAMEKLMSEVKCPE